MNKNKMNFIIDEDNDEKENNEILRNKIAKQQQNQPNGKDN